MNLHTQARSRLLADAVIGWLDDADPAHAVAIRAALSEHGLCQARSIVKAARSRFPYDRRPQAHAERVSASLIRTPAQLADWCLLGCMCHPNGYVREAASLELAGWMTEAAACAAMLAADDHVQDIRRAGRSAVEMLAEPLLAARVELIEEEWRDAERMRWRGLARKRLSSTQGRGLLRRVMLDDTSRSAGAALRLQVKTDGVDCDLLADLVGAASWRVRREAAKWCIEAGCEDVAHKLALDPRVSVRRALVRACTAAKDTVSRSTLRKMTTDPSTSIQRIACWYFKEDASLVKAHVCALRTQSSARARRRYLASVGVLQPETARQVAKEWLVTEKAAGRRAAVAALVSTGGLTKMHLDALLHETVPSVRREGRQAVRKCMPEQVGTCIRSWAKVDNAKVLPPAHCDPLTVLPTMLEALAAGDDWPRTLRTRSMEKMKIARTNQWQLPPKTTMDEIVEAWERWGSAARHKDPELVRAVQSFVAGGRAG